MSENTAIEWATHTFNPWEGCTKIGPGCDHCYAEVRNARYAGGTSINWGPGAPRRRTSAANWQLPLKWNANADAFFAEHGHRQRVFCASLADVFDNEVDPNWREALFELIRVTPNLEWLLLTKRIGNVNAMLPSDWGPQYGHVWIGATIVNQIEADRDIPKLLQVKSKVRFLSMEPLLGRVDISKYIQLTRENCTQEFYEMNGWGYDDWSGGFQGQTWHSDSTYCPEPGIHWVIVGGESGKDARPMHPAWVTSIRDQCLAAGVPFLFKQWGEWGPAGEHPYIRVGKKTAGRLLDGVTHDDFPKDDYGID